MIIHLLNQSYQAKSSDQNQSRLINMYLEKDESNSKYPIIAYPTHGLVSFCDTGQANVRALCEHVETLYTVAGSKFYSINSSGVKTELGTLNTSSGFAKIDVISGGADNNNQIVIIDGTNGYSYNLGSSTATFPISDGDFYQTAQDLTTQDDYVIVMKNDSVVFQISNVANSTAYEALDFASKIARPDRLVGINSNHEELWLMGSKTIEVWINTGNSSFPFEKRRDVFIEYGLAAKESACVIDNTLFGLLREEHGGYTFARMDGYRPLSLTAKNPAIAYQLNQLSIVSDCVALPYSLEGHSCIEFTFPTDGRTFTYDITTQMWSERQSFINSAYTRFLGSCVTFCFGKSLVGDFNSGVIYQQKSGVYTENGTAIRRMIVSQPLYFGGRRIFCHRLQIDVQTNVGSDKTFLLEKSFDQGITWTTVKTFTVPTSGDGRLYVNALGSSRNWLFRLTTTDDFNFTILGFIVDVSIGDN